MTKIKYFDLVIFKKLNILFCVWQVESMQPYLDGKSAG
jgi:hypothetical protein